MAIGGGTSGELSPCAAAQTCPTINSQSKANSATALTLSSHALKEALGAYRLSTTMCGAMRTGRLMDDLVVFARKNSVTPKYDDQKANAPLLRGRAEHELHRDGAPRGWRTRGRRQTTIAPRVRGNLPHLEWRA